MQGNKTKTTLKPIILENILEMHRKKIVDLVAQEMLHPQQHAKYYDKYCALVSKQVRGMAVDICLEYGQVKKSTVRIRSETAAHQVVSYCGFREN